jgi:hypothetical protein
MQPKPRRRKRRTRVAEEEAASGQARQIAETGEKEVRELLDDPHGIRLAYLAVMGQPSESQVGLWLMDESVLRTNIACDYAHFFLQHAGVPYPPILQRPGAARASSCN